MRIAFYNLTTTTGLGGIETFNREMARVLARRGHAVTLFAGRVGETHGLPHTATLRMYPFLPRERVPNVGTRFRKFVERLTFACFALPDLIRGGYDYIYVSKPFDLAAAIAAARASGAKVIFGSGGTEFFPGYCAMVRRVHLLFACSVFNRDQISAHCGLEPRVLPNGVDTDCFRPLERDESRAASLDLRPGVPVLMTACRLVGWKGVQHALRALALLRQRGYAPRYVVAGDGEYRGTLESLAGELDLSGQVQFIGTVSHADLPHWYSLACIAVYPSVANETFGMAIAEAMACGLPVVSTTVGGIPEVVGAEGGVLVPPRDEQALADALEKLLSSDHLRQRIASAARARVETEFSWERVADLLESRLRDADGAAHSQPPLSCTR